MNYSNIFIGLGSNLAEPAQQILRAMQVLDELPKTKVLQRSSLYRSAPVDCVAQPDFVNAVVRVSSELSPRELLNALLVLELQSGRTREFANAPRTLDLDLLLYDDWQQQADGLTVPHPRLHLRAFVLQPLLEIAPDCIIPGVGSAAEWATRCTDQVVSKLCL